MVLLPLRLICRRRRRILILIRFVGQMRIASRLRRRGRIFAATAFGSDGFLVRFCVEDRPKNVQQDRHHNQRVVRSDNDHQNDRFHKRVGDIRSNENNYDHAQNRR